MNARNTRQATPVRRTDNTRSAAARQQSVARRQAATAKRTVSSVRFTAGGRAR